VTLLGAKTDRVGRVSVGPLVGPFMNVPDVPNVFVVGDASSVVRDGSPISRGSSSSAMTMRTAILVARFASGP
jgi:NADH dehydrogenase FAD-containing subunit